MPFLEQFIDHAVHSPLWNRDRPSARQSTCVHTHNLSSPVHQRAAGKSGIKSEVEADVLIEFPSQPVLPFTADASDNAAARHQIPAATAA